MVIGIREIIAIIAAIFTGVIALIAVLTYRRNKDKAVKIEPNHVMTELHPVALRLLNEMAASSDGSIICPKTLGMSEDKQRERHHLDLLEQRGYIVRSGRGFFTLTNVGYEHLEELKKQEELKDKIRNQTARGMKGRI